MVVEKNSIDLQLLICGDLLGIAVKRSSLSPCLQCLLQPRRPPRRARHQADTAALPDVTGSPCRPAMLTLGACTVHPLQWRRRRPRAG